MKIAILDDYQKVVGTLPSFSKVAGHDVTIWNDHTKDVGKLAQRLKDAEAVGPIRKRTPLRGPPLGANGRERALCRLSALYVAYPPACPRDLRRARGTTALDPRRRRA